MILRSDEEANNAEVERDKSLRGNINKAAIGLGTAAIGGSLTGKIMPFLNQYIPAGLAMKGINKVSPKLGSFLKKGQEMGLNLEEGLSFLKDKLSNSKTDNFQTKENGNIIQQYSPELHQFLDQEIKNGRSPIEAGAIAQMNKKFSDVIKKLSKDHKTDWSSIIQSVFGNGQTAQPSQQSAQQPPQQQGQGLDPRVAQILQEGSEILKSIRGSRG